MIQNRVMVLDIIENLPDVNAEIVTQQAGGWFIAFGLVKHEKQRQGRSSKTHPAESYLWRDGDSNRFVVFAEPQYMPGPGQPLQAYNGSWGQYRCDGTDIDPDNPPERIPFTNRSIKLESNPPPNVNEENPLIVGNWIITSIWKSIPSVIGPAGLVTLP
jgi:hypothetical protein